MSSPLIPYEQLISEEISGIISPEDQAVLNKAKAENPDVRSLWEERYAAFEDPHVKNWLNKPADPASDSLLSKLRKRTWIIALLAIAITAGVYFLYPSTKKTPVLSKTIELHLQNGTVIDLSQEGKASTGNMALIKQKGSLQYSLNSDISERASLSVPAGKVYKVTLSDGTEVFMNSATTLSFPTSFTHRKIREVAINGEAYLKVAKDPNRPFILKADKVTVKVLGTEFNVNNYKEERIEVALVEGKVQFNAGSRSAMLQPGNAAIDIESGIYTWKFDANEVLSWRKGQFNFENKPLTELIKDIHRVFGEEIVLENPAIANRRCYGTLYRNDSIWKSLDRLKLKYSVDEHNVIHIK